MTETTKEEELELQLRLVSNAYLNLKSAVIQHINEIDEEDRTTEDYMLEAKLFKIENGE